ISRHPRLASFTAQAVGQRLEECNLVTIHQFEAASCAEILTTRCTDRLDIRVEAKYSLRLENEVLTDENHQVGAEQGIRRRRTY
ncbi:MAG: hypothetical protein IPF49_03690, partial [Gammaproteobacteria bacterium]|nr:hypothetical protein [Gammaproteobacteria bacterium]